MILLFGIVLFVGGVGVILLANAPCWASFALPIGLILVLIALLMLSTYYVTLPTPTQRTQTAVIATHAQRATEIYATSTAQIRTSAPGDRS